MINMTKNKNIKVGITIGDINGIGPELILKTFTDNRILSNITPVIYGNSKVLSYHKKALNIKDFNFVPAEDATKAKTKKVNLVNCWDEEVKVEIGQSTPTGGKYAFLALKKATEDLAANKVDVLVTAPINKNNIQSSEFNFPGHTEYLAKMANVDNALMFMVSEGIRVGVVTGHIPVKDVATTINKDNIYDKIVQMKNSLERDFGINKPKIAVLGLNPHAGEKGLIGEEDKKIITPAIEKAYGEGIMAFGPYPADGFFGSSNFRNFDAVLAMYHDQGLIPFKSMTFGHGVNFTAGLPIVRTSPDHGTAYELAGKGEAQVSSFRSAIYAARDIFINREFHKEITANPLQPQKSGSGKASGDTRKNQSR